MTEVQEGQAHPCGRNSHSDCNRTGLRLKQAASACKPEQARRQDWKDGGGRSPHSPSSTK